MPALTAQAPPEAFSGPVPHSHNRRGRRAPADRSGRLQLASRALVAPWDSRLGATAGLGSKRRLRKMGVRRCRTLLVEREERKNKEQKIVSEQHAEAPIPTALPLRTIGDIRAALRSGLGFPGDQETFEADLQQALEASSEADLHAVASVIVDHRGRIRLYQDPDFDIAIQEGQELTAQLKQEDPDA
ncbi:hypothetical protein [Streptomyces sp. NPDC055186]